MVNAEPLQGLNIKHAIVELAFSAFVPMNTLALAKHLFRHDESPYVAASCGILGRYKVSGI